MDSNGNVVQNALMEASIEKTEAALQESEARYRLLFENMHDGFAHCRMLFENAKPQDFIYLAVNNAFEDLTGLKDIAGMKATEATPGIKESNPELFEICSRVALTGKSERFETHVESWKAWLSISVYRAEEMTFVAVLDNITDRKRLEEAVREISLRDPLTELYNRRGFIALAEHQLKATARVKRRLRLTFIDLDGLEWIKEKLGHDEGNKALIDTANILRQTFRESDIIARIGEDEFALVAINISEWNPEAFAKRLQKNIDECNARESRRCKISLSWGTAIYDPQSPVALDQLMSAADKAMHAQKRAKARR